MMKILCLVLLLGVFTIESEAWGPRIRVPRIRLPRIRVPRIPTPRIRLPRIRLPRIRLPRIRIRVPKPNIGKIWDKASNAFKSIYKTVCGDQKKRDCGYSLVTRVQGVCNGQSCLKQNFKFGKRSIDPKTFNEQLLMNDNVAKYELSRSKRQALFYIRLALKGGAIYNQCCRKACRDVDIVKYCI
ncbi:wee1 kinase 2 [Paramuricea clavata]|uniref:Wee1 kinase 2 n=1 Tax=Paramuricea clavata TaxID=317549 RepID=A0A7D9IY35_PARCT|nr:wee1 kinase 2 [Paramuricea clavata]